MAGCALWSRIAAAAGLDAGTRERLAASELRLTRNRDLPRILLGLRGRGPLAAEARELTDALGRIYRAVVAETGCSVIVDSPVGRSTRPCWARPGSS